VDLTEDSFRALARSSPWRWSAVHLRHRSGQLPTAAEDGLEAWLVRPDGLRLVGSDGRELPLSLQEQRRDGRPTGPWRPPATTYRPDGLVAERSPQDFLDDRLLGDALFWQNYYWVAMLDPLELSHHVAVSALREDEVSGRPAWRARLVAELGYEPRCGGNCCELLYSEAGLRSDFPEPEDVPEGWRGQTYPEAYDVALDVATGIVVRCLPIGGPSDAPWLENDILESS
jgi:hypothetical protein